MAKSNDLITGRGYLLHTFPSYNTSFIRISHWYSYFYSVQFLLLSPLLCTMYNILLSVLCYSVQSPVGSLLNTTVTHQMTNAIHCARYTLCLLPHRVCPRIAATVCQTVSHYCLLQQNVSPRITSAVCWPSST